MTDDQQPGLWRRFFQTLTIPWVDKTFAILAVLPFAYELVRMLQHGQLNIPRAVLAIHFLVVIITMVIRTVPVRVTPNPWFWGLAFVATYWGLFVAAFASRGTAIVPSMVSNSISIISILVVIYARFSLGRSIGLVPAQRIIITCGAYQFVRHPIYTGIFISYTSFMLRAYSPVNVALALCGISFYLIKSVIEERFLQVDPEYAEYLTKVRWRWFPGLV
ncbi:MAG: methyltransferase family protein [Desulfobaccales bacterium]